MNAGAAVPVQSARALMDLSEKEGVSCIWG